MSFSKIFQILFIIGSTFLFFFIPECLKNSWWCFLKSFSDFEDRRRVSFKYCPILCHPLIIVFVCEIFTHPEQFKILFSLILQRPTFRDHSYAAFSSRSPNITGASFKYYLSNSFPLHPLVSKYPQVSSFVLHILTGDSSFTSFI